MLKDIVNKVSEELRRKEEIRDQALTAARKTRRLSKQAIQYIHNNRVEEAINNLNKSENHLNIIHKTLGEFSEIKQYDTVEAAYQEYAEAQILLHIVQDQPSPTPESLQIPATSYLLGMADIPGELRRQALDHLRQGDIEAAEENLEIMEDIYQELLGMDEGAFLKGLRRKLDVTRNLNERTRSEITAEASRKRLTERLEALSKDE